MCTDFQPTLQEEFTNEVVQCVVTLLGSANPRLQSHFLGKFRARNRLHRLHRLQNWMIDVGMFRRVGKLCAGAYRLPRLPFRALQSVQSVQSFSPRCVNFCQTYFIYNRDAPGGAAAVVARILKPRAMSTRPAYFKEFAKIAAVHLAAFVREVSSSASFMPG